MNGAVLQLKRLSGHVSKMRLAAEGWEEEWQTLIAVILSARTRDEITIKVAKQLFASYKTLNDLAKGKFEDVAKIIRPVNFFRNKTKSVIKCAGILEKKFGGELPHDRELLLALPGVGRKTANVFLAEFGADAIGVDTHVAYISKKLGWTLHNHPHKIESDLKELFPRRYWGVINRICVRFGKSHTRKKEKDDILSAII